MPLGHLPKWALIAPALALLLLLFITPIGWFIAEALAELGGWEDIWLEARDVIGSRAIAGAIASTNVIALMVTALVLLIGYPLSYAFSRARGLAFSLILVCIVLPYFTSVIVRTYAWMVILGRNGLINQVLLGSGLVSEPVDLLYNRTGVVIGMTYVLLPYMVLTLFAAMKAVDHRLLQAAEGMGARPLTVFRQGVPAAHPARHHRRLPDRLHPGARLLHHAGPDGRAWRRDDGHADRARDRTLAQLARSGADDHRAARHHAGAVRPLQPLCGPCREGVSR
jgi:ABC-type spermidine/putrescine transport system permease subunit I